MWSSYLKLSLMVLWRRKFFTFASLFGISFTLLVVLLAFAVLENLSNPQGPERTGSRLLHVDFVCLTNADHSSTSISPLGYRLAESVLLTLKRPERVALYTPSLENSVFIDERQATLATKATDGRFFQILEYQFLEGRPYSAAEADEGRALAVLNHTSAVRLFGNGSALGRELLIQGRSFQVIGVVADVSSTLAAGFAEVWVPLFALNQPEALGNLTGNLLGLIQPSQDRDIPAIKEELARSLRHVDFPDDDYDTLYIWAETRLESIARELMDTRWEQSTKLAQFFSLLAIVVILFLLLPSINLINLNLSRILERASEVGLRKAFGASTRVLVLQFVFENTVLTVLGGLLAFLLTPLVFAYLERLDLIPYAHFAVNFRVFVLALATMVVFSVLSGAWPAWKMARLLPAAALKGGSP